MAKVNHTTFRNSKLFCLHCGRDQVVPYPLEIEMMTAMLTAFNKIHKDCKPTWKEPTVDLSKSESYRANWWYFNGERGASSEAIYYCMTGTNGRKDHPYDPDDFARCYKLLQVVPEWKSDLYKMKELSNAWSNLIENWDKLTDMFEQNERTNWKQYKKIGMYEFMQTLINP